MQKQLYKLLPLASVLLLLFSGCSPLRTQPVSETAVAMGSVVTLKLYGKDQTQMQNTAESMLQGVQTLDTQVISKNAESAELYRLNALENTETPVQISGELYDALKETKAIYAHSDGKAALASGVLTEIWGIDTEDFRVPSSAEIELAKTLCRDETVIFEQGNRISFQNGQKLNLGSVGKGLACDKAVAVLRENGFENGITGAVITVGGSVATVGTPDSGEHWTIGIRDPYGEEDSYFATLRVGEAFLSTSGTYEKQFTVEGRTYHHLLDLTTGCPAESTLCAVTVVAPTGLQSDALSTLCFLTGEENAREALELYNAEAVFVYADKTVHVTDGLKAQLQLSDNSYRLENV